MIFGLFMLLVAFQDDIAVENLDSVSLNDKFEVAFAKFNTVERNEARHIFLEIVTALEARSTRTEDDLLILTESLKCLGVIDFPERTEEYFKKLIGYDPDFDLNPRDLSPKIVAVFTRLKEELVGTLTVTASDAVSGQPIEGAVMVVDGLVVGAVLGATRFSVFTGKHLLEVRRPNYESFIKETEVGKEGRLDVVMNRNAAELVLVTSPADVEVFLEAESRGFTSGEVPAYYNRPLASEGLSRDQAGSLVIDGLQPGKYTLTFRKPCYKPLVASKEVTEYQQLNVSPIKLEQAGARLSVRTNGDNTGIVFLDQKRLGFLPIENHLVCPDDYTLKVTFTDGEYIKKISIADGENREFLAEPLPSIAWFGLQDEEEGRPPVDLEQALLALKTWNVQVIDSRDTTTVPINPFPALFAKPTIDERDKQVFLSRQLKADLYLAARVVRKKVLIRNLEIAFWTPLSDRIHVKSFDFRESDKLEKLIASMDFQPELTKPWLGIQTARLQGLQGCRIIEVDPNGPLAAKVSPGEMVTGINDNVVRNPGELIAMTQMTEVVLDVEGRQVQVQPVAATTELPFDAVQLVPQALLAKLEKIYKYHPDQLMRDSARFNQARYRFFIGDVQQAFDIFTTMKLTAPYGINQGTLLFYQGLCFRQLKLASEANTSFKAVLDYPNATLFDAYGPRAAFWADAERNTTNP